MVDGSVTNSETAQLSTQELSAVTGFRDAVALAESHFGEVALAHEVIGDGFGLERDKGTLIGVPLIILSFAFVTDKESQREFVTVRAVTERDEKVVFNDGSTGVYAQLKQFHSLYGMKPIAVAHGLRVSEYMADVPQKGGGTKKEPAKTYYLSTDAPRARR